MPNSMLLYTCEHITIFITCSQNILTVVTCLLTCLFNWRYVTIFTWCWIKYYLKWGYILPIDLSTLSNNHLHQCSNEYRIINNNDPVSRYNNVYEKRDTGMRFYVTCSSMHKVFLHTHAQILLQILYVHVQYAFSCTKHSHCHGYYKSDCARESTVCQLAVQK
jgi:hypothetical protein